MVPRAKNISSCYNPSCAFYNKSNDKAPLKCGRCKTAHYCDKNCQRSHWSVHKEFCEVWAESAANNGQIPVAKVKKKMTQLIWLIRGLPEYTKALFKEYHYHQRLRHLGCIEFYFESYEELFGAIKVLEALPVIGEETFYPMPIAPTYKAEKDGTPIPQKLPIRALRESDETAFIRAIDSKMTFTQSDKEARPNMMNQLEMLGDNKRLFLICVTVKLQGTYSTHMYDYIYERLSWYPDDTPLPLRKPNANN